MFPATRFYEDEQSGERRRHHLHESVVQRAMKDAARAAGLTRPATCHSLRHSFATLEPGTPVYVEDLEAWERKAGLRIAAGDAIFLRTGRWARRDKLGPWNLVQASAGIHASAAPWIKTRGVAFIGSDAALDVLPSRVEGVTLPVHVLMIAALGINLLDNQDLEALAATAAKLNRWEFMLTVAPVPVTGGTGFPVNALATF